MMSNDPRVVALIPAAGCGNRMGSSTPKALIDLLGQSLLSRSVGSVLESGAVSELLVMAPKEYLDSFKEGLCFSNVTVICGGATRQESVWAGLEQLRTRYEDTQNLYVLVHDAARCLVSPQLVSKSIEAAKKHGALTTAMPCVDTITQSDENGFIEEALDRTKLWVVQTPQVFLFDLLYKAHQEAQDNLATDDASLVREIHPVYLLEGEERNIKITRPGDLKVAESLL